MHATRTFQLLEQALQGPLEAERMRRRARVKHKFAAQKRRLERQLAEISEEETRAKVRELLDNVEAQERQSLAAVDESVEKERELYERGLDASMAASQRRKAELQAQVRRVRRDFEELRKQISASVAAEHNERSNKLVARLADRRARTAERLAARDASAEEISRAVEQLDREDHEQFSDLQQRMQDELFGKLAEHEAQCRNQVEELTAQEQALEQVMDQSVRVREALVADMQRRRELEEDLDARHWQQSATLQTRLEKRKQARLVEARDEADRQRLEAMTIMEEAQEFLDSEAQATATEHRVWLEVSQERTAELQRAAETADRNSKELKTRLAELNQSHETASDALRNTMDQLRTAKTQLIQRQHDDKRRSIECDPGLSEDDKKAKLQAVDKECRGALQQLEDQVMKEWEQLQEKQMGELRQAIQAVESSRMRAATEAVDSAERSHQDAKDALDKMKESHDQEMQRLSEEMATKKHQERERLQGRLAKKRARRAQELAQASEEERRREEERQAAEARREQEELEAKLAAEEARLRAAQEEALLAATLAAKRRAEEAEARRVEAEKARANLHAAREHSREAMSRSELEGLLRREQEEAGRNRAERKKNMVEQRKKLMDRLAARRNRRERQDSRVKLDSPSNQRQKGERESLTRKQAAELVNLEEQLVAEGSIAEARQAGVRGRQLLEQQLGQVAQERDDLQLRLAATVEGLNKSEEQVMNLEDKVHEVEAALAAERAARRAEQRRMEELEETNVTLEMQLATRSDAPRDRQELEDQVQELQEELEAQQAKMLDTAQQLRRKTKKAKELKDRAKALEKDVESLQAALAAAGASGSTRENAAMVAEAKSGLVPPVTGADVGVGAKAEAKMMRQRGAAAGAAQATKQASNASETDAAENAEDKDRELAELRVQLETMSQAVAEAKMEAKAAHPGRGDERKLEAEVQRLQRALEEKEAAVAALAAAEASAKAESAQVVARARADAEAAAEELRNALAVAHATEQEVREKLASVERQLAAAETSHAEALEKAQAEVAHAASKAHAEVGQTMIDLQQTADQAIEARDSLEREKNAILSELNDAKNEIGRLNEVAASLDAVQARAADADRLEQELRAAAATNDKMWGDLRKEQLARKKLHNQVEDMKGKIRVFARCRPMSEAEQQRGCEECATFDDPTTLTVSTTKTTKTFAFDSVFPPTSSQEEVFEDVEMLIDSVVDGYNVCVFAYGQTGSGKTFTMTGSQEQPGLTPRSVAALFRRIAEMGVTHDFTVQLYFLELYNDGLVDLLFALNNPTAKATPKLDIKLDANRQVCVKGAMVQPVSSSEEVLQIFTRANGMRKVGATAMNAQSSRSHSIFSIIVEGRNRASGSVSSGKLSLIDLAGSERANKTGATKERLQEANSINKSLSALGDVISALSTGSAHVPYRNNKLTQLMQDSLGGNAKTLMFVNFSPADYNADETLGALTYAARTKSIKNDATKRTDSAEVAKLKKKIKDLEDRVAASATDPERGAAEDDGDHAAAAAAGEEELDAAP